MKNIKDITLSIFAIIGFVTILSSFNNQSQETHSTVPESHAWEFHSTEESNGVGLIPFSFNKVTGEVRKHNSSLLSIGKNGSVVDVSDNKYVVMVEAK